MLILRVMATLLFCLYFPAIGTSEVRVERIRPVGEWARHLMVSGRQRSALFRSLIEHGTTFDTRAAIEAGNRVAIEIQDRRRSLDR